MIENKTKYITPVIMLSAASLAIIIMVMRQFELMTMLKILAVVFVVFYIIGDIVRYIYASIRPKVIPDLNLQKLSTFKGRNPFGIMDNEISEDMDEDEDISYKIGDDEVGMDDLFADESFMDMHGQPADYTDEINYEGTEDTSGYESVMEGYDDSIFVDETTEES